MAQKGITPVVALVVLLLVTVSLAGISYVFIFQLMQGETEKGFIIPHGGAYCDAVAGTNTITITVRNTGLAAAIGEQDFIIKTVTAQDGIPYEMGSEYGDSFPRIPPQDSGAITTSCIEGCAWGRNVVRLSTGTMTADAVVICP